MTEFVAAIESDQADAQRLAEGLQDLRERRGLYDQTNAELEAARDEGRRRVAELQAQVDEETRVLVVAANEAAEDFNDAAAKLVETGFITPKGLANKGLSSIRMRKVSDKSE